MLQNPIHLRLEKLESWQHVTFMACLCERMYPITPCSASKLNLAMDRFTAEFWI
jgi:uncharacterized protein YjaG (DUF416 family)